jgi:hypothetical protein
MRRYLYLMGLLTFLLPVVVIAVVIHDHASPEATTLQLLGSKPAGSTAPAEEDF